MIRGFYGMYDKRQDEDYKVAGYNFYFHEMLPIKIFLISENFRDLSN